MRIDSHQHFWQFDPIQHEWINDEMRVIQKDFMPNDLAPLIAEHKIDGTILVQVDQNEEGNDFMLSLADGNDFIKAVVGWLDLRADNLEERIDHFKQNKKFSGVRHVLQQEPDGFMYQQEFRDGIRCLSKHGLTYDVLTFPHQLAEAADMVGEFPEQIFIIDHLSKPYIKSGRIEQWAKDMRKFKEMPNVYCKVSGMITEAEWTGWKKDDFTPYLDLVTEVFGADRLMYGSDWPVCLCAGSYDQVYDLAAGYFNNFSEAEKQSIFGNNATKVYLK